MNGRFLLDTNIIIGLLSGDPNIQFQLAATEHVFLPAIAVGELYFGAAKSAKPDANRSVIESFVQNRIILSCDISVAREYGDLKGILRAHGTPIPENDIWIAATALRHGLTVVTRDQHFRLVPNLSISEW